MKFSIAVARILISGVLIAFASLAGAQQAYPSKPIRFIVPYPPGGTFTVVARLVGQKLTESWGQSVMVDNRGGGNTIIGTEALAKSAPDGYTMLVAGSTHVTLPHLYPKLPFDVIGDFAPVATIIRQEIILALHPSVPPRNLRELISLAKSKPGQLNYAAAGVGTSNHLAGELLNMLAGIKTQHIPYKGGGPVLTDLVGGQVHMSYLTPIVVIPHIKSGKVKGIAVSGETRLAALPQVPTFTESGLQGFDVRSWVGVLAPAGTPKAIINKLSAEIARILAMADIEEKLATQGVDPLILTPEQFDALIKADFAKYAKIIKAANIKLED